jgi:hypothetical protein
MVFTTVDLPWPLAPRMPMRWPASTDLLTFCTMTVGDVPSGCVFRGGVAEVDVLDRQHGVGQVGRLFELEGEVGFGQQRRDFLHAVQRLDAALRLLGLAGLGLEAGNELLQVGDFVLLLGVRPTVAAPFCSARRSSNSL